MQEKWQKKNILRFFILQTTPQSKKSGLGDTALSSAAPCFGAAVSAEAVVWRDNAATCGQLSPDMGFRAVIFRAVGQTAYTFWFQTSKIWGLKQPKDTFSGPTKRCIFFQGFLFFPPFSFYWLLCAWQTVAILTWRYASWWAAWG